MPGMNSGLNANNATLVAAFRTAVLHQGIIVLTVFTVLAFAWVALREWMPSAARRGAVLRSAGAAEPTWRTVLRIGFGIIWIFDGLLQAQPAMAAGLPSQVIEPTAASSPGWVQHIVNWAGTSWSYHPVEAGAAAVWIQLGIGVWLIAAPRGPLSRLAGLASVAWGLIVWVFGESFGGIFAPGLTWLFGAPGAALIYCAAGVLIALPERSWRSPQLGRTVLGALGVFFVGMAVLQAWPGRGFWQGTLHGQQGTLTSMVHSMATTPQPSLFAGWVASFASFTSAHGFAVNLFAVVALASIGAGLLAAGRVPRWLALATIIAMAVFCLADWVLIEDFGFFGGLGTDPNSMIPMLLLAVAGYLALAPAAEPVPTPAARSANAEPASTSRPAGAVAAGPGETKEPDPETVRPEKTGPARERRGWREQLQPSRLASAFAAVSTRAVLAIWAVAIIIIGAAPMAAAQASRNADPIIAQAIDGDSAPLNFPAPAFQLTDQYGNQVSLASLHGKVVLLTFLDPVCTNDCPVIGDEFRQADQVLGAKSRDVEMVAIVANPLYRSIAYTQAFDNEDQLSTLPNWLYLTGSLAQLQQAWKNYDVAAEILPAGGMIAHSDVAYVIDPDGHTRTELDFDPGPGTTTTESSFAVELSDAAEQVMK
jgi:cytochrome oxidase Cu insertion factor (SCO1/SenC/PrrC family)